MKKNYPFFSAQFSIFLTFMSQHLDIICTDKRSLQKIIFVSFALNVAIPVNTDKIYFHTKMTKLPCILNSQFSILTLVLLNPDISCLCK